MSGHYLPLATIAWGLALNYTMANMDFPGQVRRPDGRAALTVFGMALNDGGHVRADLGVCAGRRAGRDCTCWTRRPGRAIRALKRAPPWPRPWASPPSATSSLVFVLAAHAGGHVGLAVAHFQRTVNPSPFGINKGIEYLFMAVLGGVGHVWGAFLGAGVVKMVEDQLQVLLPKLIGTSGNFEIIVFGIVMVVVLKYAPDGLWSFVARCAATARTAAGTGPTHRRCPRAASPSAGDLLLQVQAVRKEFGGLVAVNDISFEIRAGDIVGLIGPNGAGKSTTFNLITGVLGAHQRRGALRGEPSRPAVAADRAGGHVAHLPAREDDPRDDGAGERGPGRLPAQRSGARGAMLRLDRA
jgi:branched-chain amino acid transport system permease protein